MMREPFLYTCDEEARDALLGMGYPLLQESGGKWVFLYTEGLGDSSGLPVYPSGMLTFSEK